MNDMNESKYSQTEGLTAIIHKARQGEKASMGQLAEVAEPRLRTYIFRLTLNQDLTEELCQKVLVKMVQSLKNLDTARHFIDTLEMLEKKTAGNLEQDEQRLLDEVLHQLRMSYMQEQAASRPDGPALPDSETEASL